MEKRFGPSRHHRHGQRCGLNNGNTLISGNQHGYVRELNRNGETVWEINNNDFPGIALYTVQEVSRLANGNTLSTSSGSRAPATGWEQPP